MNLSELKPGQVYTGIVKIVGIRTAGPSGPVILRVSDGTFTLEAVTRKTDLAQGDIAELTGPALRRLGKVQIEIKTLTKTDKPLPEQAGALPGPANLIVQTAFNEEKLKPMLLAAANRIRSAIIADQPIILRHHADADGATGSILLEKSLQSLCRSRGMKPEQYVYRMPSKVPFYDIQDALWDASFTKRVLESRGLARPLIVIIDNGSTEEDVFALKLMSAMGFSIIVIDHHNPGTITEGTCAVDPYIETHANPLLAEGSYWTTSGMMCYEIAHLINPGAELPILAGISAVADRSQSEEGAAYIARSGKSLEELKDLAICFDFLTYHLRNEGATSIFDEVISNRALCKAICDEVRHHSEHQMEILVPHTKTEQTDNAWLSIIDLSKLGERAGFPPPGKMTGMIHDRIKAEKGGRAMTLGVLSGLIIIRESEPILPVKELIAAFKKAHPTIPISGGGHDVAGTIKCPPDAVDTLIALVKKTLSSSAPISQPQKSI